MITEHVQEQFWCLYSTLVIIAFKKKKIYFLPKGSPCEALLSVSILNYSPICAAMGFECTDFVLT